jgi:DNA-directed RNA polymerase specialized sigma24 family protein
MTVIRMLEPSLRPRRRATDRPSRSPSPVPGTSTGDSSLVRAAALGDVAAWDRLVDGHAQRVWDRARAAGLDRPSASEVCEVVWLRLAQALPDLDGLPLPVWLGRAVAVEAALVRRREDGRCGEQAVSTRG